MADPADGWNRESHEMKRDAFGVFEISIPAVHGQAAIPHDSKIKVCILSPQNVVDEIRSP